MHHLQINWKPLFHINGVPYIMSHSDTIIVTKWKEWSERFLREGTGHSPPHTSITTQPVPVPQYSTLPIPKSTHRLKWYFWWAFAQHQMALASTGDCSRTRPRTRRMVMKHLSCPLPSIEDFSRSREGQLVHMLGWCVGEEAWGAQSSLAPIYSDEDAGTQNKLVDINHYHCCPIMFISITFMCSYPDRQTLPYWCSTQCQQRDIVLGSSMILMTSTWLLGLTFFAFI